MKARFLAGIAALLPIGLTVFVVWFLVTKLGRIIGSLFAKVPLLRQFPSPIISLIGLGTLVVFVYIIGAITSSYIGKRLFRVGERFLERVPIIRPLYTALRQFTQAIFLERSAFKKVVLVEYPRKGVYTIAFVTNETGWQIKKDHDYINLFVPTAPNPTSGYYVILPREETIPVDLTIDEALKTIVSGGVIIPKGKDVQED
ncbi:MAG TPA: DUF502 domain-containing protein [bacterium (Candidatus Stahlbacteria)]|nr:DUF502 domain-containing protein [Candidatus Stahlbacteria bacterium]